MQPDSSRNTIIFLVCALVLFFAYQHFVLDPATKRHDAEVAAAKAAAPAASILPGAPGAPAGMVAVKTRAEALSAGPRVPVATPSLQGSLSLKGARIDDLFLTQYRTEISKTSPPVELLRPEGAQHAWFVEFGWTGANIAGLPDAQTLWTLTQGSTLAPGQPVVLSYTNAAGLTFTRRIEVDDKFMFTVADTVANLGPLPVTLAPYGSVQRQGVPPDIGKSGIVHEGATGWLDGRVRRFKYKDLMKKAPVEFNSTGAWTGITDKYWLAALIPNPAEQVHTIFRDTKTGGIDVFEANFTGAARVIPAGQQVTVTQHLFVGAKTVPQLQAYEKKLGVAHLDEAVDWGMFWFLTRPIFLFLQYIFQHVGNFGVAILLLTVAVRVIFFPLANKSYESMTKMKKVQPLVEEMRKKFKDDPAKQQQEMMALYQREKVNPLAGCLPLLLQIPVFFALYKVLSVTIEMRHAPFFGWIRDLSAPDSTNIWNLFGLLPWDPATAPLIGGFIGNTALQHGFLALGVLPLLYGVTMWLTTSMNPPAPDPMQQRIFQLMPLVFTFIMAPFAAGLLIYWTWSNILTSIQQYVIMRRFKVDNPIDKLIARFTGEPKVA